MSLDGVKTSTDKLRDVMVVERLKSTPQIDLVKKSHDYTRDVMAKTYSTSPQVIEGLADSFLNFLDSSDETKDWYNTWKSGDSLEFWGKVQDGFMRDKAFLQMTSKFDENGRGQMVRPLSWLVVSDRFVAENTPKPSPEIPINTVPVEVIQPSGDDIIMSEEAKKDGFKPEEEHSTDPKQAYGEAVKDAGKNFWKGFNDLADMVEGHFALLGLASLVPIIPAVYSGADIAVALNGYREWEKGKKTGNKTLSDRGMLKMVISIIPMLPGSYAAPIIDNAIKIDKKNIWIKK